MTAAIDYFNKTNDELNDELMSLKKEQFNLRFQKASGQLENTARMRQVRRDIARVKTILNTRDADGKPLEGAKLPKPANETAKPKKAAAKKAPAKKTEAKKPAAKKAADTTDADAKTTEAKKPAAKKAPAKKAPAKKAEAKTDDKPKKAPAKKAAPKAKAKADDAKATAETKE